MSCSIDQPDHCSVLGLLMVLIVLPFDVQQSDLLLWGSLYVLAKWTIGIWAFRRARAYITQRRAAQRVV